MPSLAPGDDWTSESEVTATQRSQASRISVTLAGPAAELVQDLAEAHHTSIAEVVRQALSLQKFVDEEVARGADILVREPSGEVMKVRFVFG